MDLISNLQTTLDATYQHDVDNKIEVDSVTNFPADGVVRVDDGTEWCLQRYDVVDVPNKELETLTDPKAIFESSGASGHTFAIGTTVTLVFTGDYLDEIAAATPVLANGTVPLTANWDAGAFQIRALTFRSDIATGNPPLIVASTTVIPNLNADMVDGQHFAAVILANGTVPLTAAWDAGAFQIRALMFRSDVVTGTAPFTVTSTTVVPNLNADMVDGKDATDLVLVDGTQVLTANWDVGAFDVRVQNLTADALGAGLVVYTGANGLLAAEAAFAYNAATNVATIPTIDLTGGQIAFPAGVQVSADANTLDDYEEGTWTPDLQFGGAKVGITYAGQLGNYTKIGNRVIISGYTILTSKGVSNGDAEIHGLPFPVANDTGAVSPVSLYLSKISFANQYMGWLYQNESKIRFSEITEGGAVTTLTDANFANDSEYMYNVVYQAG